MIQKILMIALALLLVSCGEEALDNTLQGYVEGKQLNLAPRSAGIVTGLNVKEGDKVQAGVLLFAVDSERAQAQLDEAIAGSAAAEAQLLNLQKGGRPEEIRAAEEALREAEAAYVLAQQNYERTKNLVERGVASTAKLDQDRAALDASRARVTEAQSRLAIVQLPARPDVIDAARREVEARKSAIIGAQTELRDRSVLAPVSGRIETIYRRVGEVAGPTQPVLALLPPDQKRIRFFVAEAVLPQVHHGGRVVFSCDGCDTNLGGEIIFISDQAEFTPPVIFSDNSREKLVYMIEAMPDDPEKFLDGQPVGVTLQ